MEVLYIFLVGLIITIIVVLIATTGNDSKRKKYENLIESLAPNDIEKIKQAMIELGISVPADSDSNTKTLRSYLNELCKYADSKVKAGRYKRYKYKDFYFSDLYIYYNKKQVIIPSDLLCNFNENRYGFKIYASENEIKYFGTREKNDGMSVSTLIDNVKMLDDKDFIKSNFDTINWDDLIWYLDGVPKHMMHTGSIATGAIGGALLLGPVGAVAGAISGNKDAKEAKERILREMKLVFGYCGGRKWVINTDWDSSSFQDDFQFFLENCPDRRGKNIERIE